MWQARGSSPATAPSLNTQKKSGMYSHVQYPRKRKRGRGTKNTRNKETAVKLTRAIIFPATAKFGPALVLALVACSMTYAQDVRTNYMPGTDFSKYHTYAWVNDIQGVPAVGGHPDQILDAQVKQAIDSQMAAKGLTRVEDGSKADLLLGYQLAIDQEKQVNAFGNNFGSLGPWPSWGPWGGWGPWAGGSG